MSEQTDIADFLMPAIDEVLARRQARAPLDPIAIARRVVAGERSNLPGHYGALALSREEIVAMAELIAGAAEQTGEET